MTGTRFFGLDGEMSSNRIEDGHRLIQIGVAVDTAPDGGRLDVLQVFTSLIGWRGADLPWEERAEQVHGIPRAAVLAAPRADEVDAALYAWLVGHGINTEERKNNVAVGFNVGAFDFPFFVQALPASASLFSRRFADLNPLCFALGTSVPISGGQPSFEAWKRRITEAGRRLVADIGRTEAEHDAGTDALIALGAWRHIEETLAGLDADATRWRKAERKRRKREAQRERGWGRYAREQGSSAEEILAALGISESDQAETADPGEGTDD